MRVETKHLFPDQYHGQEALLFILTMHLCTVFAKEGIFPLQWHYADPQNGDDKTLVSCHHHDGSKESPLHVTISGIRQLHLSIPTLHLPLDNIDGNKVLCKGKFPSMHESKESRL